MQIEGGGEPFDRSEVARDLIRRLDHWYDASRSRGRRDLERPLASPERASGPDRSGSRPRPNR